MSEWKNIRFGKLYKLPSRNGLNRPSAVRGEGYKMINMGELFANDRIGAIEMERVKLNENEKKNFDIQKYDLLFARQSMVAEGAGKCSIVIDVPELTCFESHLIRVRLSKENASPIFYYYLFQSSLGKALLSSIRLQGVQAGIKGTDLVKLEVPFPHLSEQNRITSILSTYDELIENNNSRIAILEQTAEQIYKEWFVRMRFPGYENTEFEKGVPKGWKEIKLKDAIIVKNGKSCELNDKGIYKVYGSNGCIGLSERYNYENVIIVGRVGAYCGAVDFGFGKVWATDNALVIYLIDTKATYYYTYYLLKMLNLGNFASGSAQPLLTQSILYKMKVFLPNIQILRNFDKIIFSLFAQIRILQQENINLKQTRDLLLPRLISGKLKVSSSVRTSADKNEAEKEIE